jgi:hypothetical protein
MAADGRSLAVVVATVADALAADDTDMQQKYWITYEEAAALSPKKVGTQSDFLQSKAEWKEQTDITCRKFHIAEPTSVFKSGSHESEP